MRFWKAVLLGGVSAGLLSLQGCVGLREIFHQELPDELTFEPYYVSDDDVMAYERALALQGLKRYREADEIIWPLAKKGHRGALRTVMRYQESRGYLCVNDLAHWSLENLALSGGEQDIWNYWHCVKHRRAGIPAMEHLIRQGNEKAAKELFMYWMGKSYYHADAYFVNFKPRTSSHLYSRYDADVDLAKKYMKMYDSILEERGGFAKLDRGTYYDYVSMPLSLYQYYLSKKDYANARHYLEETIDKSEEHYANKIYDDRYKITESAREALRMIAILENAES